VNIRSGADCGLQPFREARSLAQSAGRPLAEGRGENSPNKFAH